MFKRVIIGIYAIVLYAFVVEVLIEVLDLSLGSMSGLQLLVLSLTPATIGLRILWDTVMGKDEDRRRF